MKKPRVFKRLIKEAFDNLPNGVAFFNEKGLLVLCNHAMHRLAFALTGKDLQSLFEMQNALEHLPESASVARDGGLFLLPGNKAWRLSIVKVADRYGDVYTQMVAADITELYQSRLALEESNRRLVEHGKRLRDLSANINAVTREEEVLHMKMRVHDDVGRSVIAARQLLLQHLSLIHI